MFFSGGSVHPKRFTTIDSTNLQLGQTIQNVEKDVLRKKSLLTLSAHWNQSSRSDSKRRGLLLPQRSGILERLERSIFQARDARNRPRAADYTSDYATSG